MIGKRIITTKLIIYGNNIKLPIGSTGTIVRQGLDGWIMKLEKGIEMWIQ